MQSAEDKQSAQDRENADAMLAAQLAEYGDDGGAEDEQPDSRPEEGRAGAHLNRCHMLLQFCVTGR